MAPRPPKTVRRRRKKASLAARFGPRLLALLLGALLVLLVTEVGLRAVGWAFTVRQERANRQEAERGASRTVLCLGESTTALGGEDSWPAQLGDVLREWSGSGAFQVINGGVPGTSSKVLTARLPQDLLRFRPQAVVVMMGANETGGAIPPPVEDQGAVAALIGHSRIVRLVRQARLVRDRGGWRAPGARDRGQPDDAGQEAALWQGAAAQGAPPVQALVGLGRFYEERNRTEEAEEVFRRALDRCPGCLEPQLELARHFERLQDDPSAEALFRAATEAHPDSAKAWFGLGRILRKEERFEEGLAAFDRAIALDPRDVSAWTDLGLCLDAAGRHEEAGQALRRGWEATPTSARAFLRLADYYEQDGDDAAMDEISRRATAEPGEGGVIEGRIALYWTRRGETTRAEAARARADAVQRDVLPLSTRESYGRMLDLLTAAGIPLVAVQYPTRSARPLTALFAERPEVAVVDNERLFREALAERPYADLFWDNCYGDFGHATRLGNRMLAENVARTLFAGVFAGMGEPP